MAKTPERRMIPMTKVPEILEVTPERFRALVLLAVFAGLRWGELAGLRRRHLDLQQGTVTVEVTIYELDGGKLQEGTPKSDAGRRVVAFPAEILPDLRAHLDEYTEAGLNGRVFVGPKGGPLRRSGFRRAWNKDRADVGVPGLHFHDLRHLGDSVAAKNASLKELMARMGHSSTRAALIYQHGSEERDREIAADLGKALKRTRKGTKKKASGTQRARKREKAR